MQSARLCRIPTEKGGPDVRKIDIEHWERREIFRFFSPLSNPFYAVTFRLDVTELCRLCKARGLSSPGREAIEACVDPRADIAPGPEAVAATRRYSSLAVTCFCCTIGAIALLLTGLLIAGDPKTLAVKGIVIGFIIAIALFIGIYVIYRLVRKAA